MGYKKCPICGEKVIDGKSNMIAHIDKYHSDEVPSDKTAGEYLYLYEHNGKPRKCMMCSKPATWNKATDKFNAFCSDKCKDAYVKMVRARMKKVHGVENLLDDPDQQKKMLANRSISGEYLHTDGGRWKYTGSYEKDFCQMNDMFLSMPSEDIIMPSPNVYHYMYKGEKKFYIPDAFIPSAGIEIEIKDGGSNPNMHHKIQDVDKVKEALKDAVMMKQKDFHYIKIVNKNYGDYFKLIEKIRSDNLTPMEKSKKIKLIPKGNQETVLETSQTSNSEEDLDMNKKEALSDYAHDSWSKWMKYLFSLSQTNEDGTVTIPKEQVERWNRQMTTKYIDLPDSEKASDIKEAEKIMSITGDED